MILLPFVTAVRYNRILRAFVLFVECFASGLYHLCDSFDVCAFDFTSHHHLDFFFAQSLIVLAAFYFIEFGFGWAWLEWVLILVGLLTIAVLQITLPGELYVQAGIAIMSAFIVGVYWCIWGVPKYDMHNMQVGVTLLSLSVILFAVQEKYSPLYWAIHSLWHTCAFIGLDYILRIKHKAYRFESAASRIGRRVQTVWHA